MSRDFCRNAWTTLNPVSKISFAVAIAAFGTALLGLVINQIFTGWMAAGGMTGVGLFYLAIGVLNLDWRSSSIPAEGQEEERLRGAQCHATGLSVRSSTAWTVVADTTGGLPMRQS